MQKKLIEEILRKETPNLKDALLIAEIVTSPTVEKSIRNVADKIAESTRKKLQRLPKIQPAQLVLEQLLELFAEL